MNTEKVSHVYWTGFCTKLNRDITVRKNEWIWFGTDIEIFYSCILVTGKLNKFSDEIQSTSVTAGLGVRVSTFFFRPLLGCEFGPKVEFWFGNEKVSFSSSLTFTFVYSTEF